MAQSHVEPPLIPLIKVIHNSTSEKYFVYMKFHRDLTSSTSDLYTFWMSLYDNGNTEEILLFVCNFNMTLAATRMLEKGAKIHYIRTLVCGEALREF